MLISTDEKKHLKKIQHPFMIKTLNKVGIKANSLNIIRAICEKPTAILRLHGKSLKLFP